jgi:hypothetical protein
MKRILLFIFVTLLSSYAFAETKINIAGFKTHIDWTNYSDIKFDEKVYMAVHAIDILQTMQHGPNPCYGEVDPITRRLIGRDPSPGRVFVWGLARGALAHYEFQFINNSNLPKWLRTTLKWYNTAVRFEIVENNYQLGLTLYGDRPDYYRGGPALVACAAHYGI